MVFRDKQQLQEAVKFYHTKHDREYVVVETNPKLWVVKCKNGCTWRLRASKSNDEHGYFKITKYNGDHHCMYPHTSQDHVNLDMNVIAKMIISYVKCDPDMRISLVIEKVKNSQRYTISYKKAWRARKKAIQMVFGDWDESYRRLPRFIAALQKYNPGTVVE